MSDAKYIDAQKGIVSIDRERWELAQRFEKNYWMQTAKNAIQDRNTGHAKHFENYELLRGAHFEHALEIGCGPFTNLRIIARICSIDMCALEDPLIDTYLSHPNCAFTRKALSINYKTHKWNPFVRALRFGLKPFSRDLASRVGTALSRLLSPKISITKFISEPIEDMPVPQQYDLVVMINVIEHCRDFNRICEQILALSKPGSTFVFADKYFSPDDLAAVREGRVANDGHPLMPLAPIVDEFLNRNFSPLLRSLVWEEVDQDGEDKGHRVIYFIGTRNSERA